MYNIRITKPIGHNVDRVIKYFNQSWDKTTEILRKYANDGYNVKVSEA